MDTYRPDYQIKSLDEVLFVPDMVRSGSAADSEAWGDGDGLCVRAPTLASADEVQADRLSALSIPDDPPPRPPPLAGPKPPLVGPKPAHAAPPSIKMGAGNSRSSRRSFNGTPIYPGTT